MKNHDIPVPASPIDHEGEILGEPLLTESQQQFMQLAHQATEAEPGDSVGHEDGTVLTEQQIAVIDNARRTIDIIVRNLEIALKGKTEASIDEVETRVDIELNDLFHKSRRNRDAIRNDDADRLSYDELEEMVKNRAAAERASSLLHLFRERGGTVSDAIDDIIQRTDDQLSI